MDVRFLPNPYFVEELKRLNGQDSRVRTMSFKGGGPRVFAAPSRVYSVSSPLVRTGREGTAHRGNRMHGGRHRSIVIVNRLAAMLQEESGKRGTILHVRHRDVEKDE